MTYREGLVDQDTYKYLSTQFPQEATFYALPKIHKNPSLPPGRPMVSGLLQKMPVVFIDFFDVVLLTSYIRDALDFLKQIEGLVVPPMPCS